MKGPANERNDKDGGAAPAHDAAAAAQDEDVQMAGPAPVRVPATRTGIDALMADDDDAAPGAPFRIANVAATLAALEGDFEASVRDFFALLSGEEADDDGTMARVFVETFTPEQLTSLSTEAARAFMADAARQTQAVLFRELRGMCVPNPSPDDIEPLDRELAAAVEARASQARELSLLLEKKRDTLEFSAPAAVRADYARRRAAVAASLENVGVVPPLHAGSIRPEADASAAAKPRRSSLAAAEVARAAAALRAEAARAAMGAVVEPMLDDGLRAGLAISREIMEDIGGSVASQAAALAAATRDVGDTQAVLDAVLSKGPAPIDLALKAAVGLGNGTAAPRPGGAAAARSAPGPA